MSGFTSSYTSPSTGPRGRGSGNRAFGKHACISRIRRSAAFIAVSFLLLSAGCVSSRALTAEDLQKKIYTAGNALINDIRYADRLSSKRVGKTGFFYILDRDDTVRSHPVKALEGRSFSSYSFIKKMRQRGSGCIRFGIESGENLLFFRTLENGWIICLSVMAEEIHGQAPACVPLKEE